MILRKVFQFGGKEFPSFWNEQRSVVGRLFPKSRCGGLVRETAVLIKTGCGSIWMFFNISGFKDMKDGPSANFQIIGNQRPVTSPPDGLGAHDRRSASLCLIDQILDSFFKLL